MLGLLKSQKAQQKDSIDRVWWLSAYRVGDAQRDRELYDENIEQMPKQASVAETKREVEQEEEKSDADFFASLRQVNNIEDNHLKN